MNTSTPVTWILEINPDFTDPELLTNHVRKFEAIENFNLQYKDWPKVEGPCVVFGTFNCLTQMLKNPDLCNYIFDDYSLLDCSTYYRYVYQFLGRFAFIVPMSAIQYIDLERIFGQSVFIRPNSNKKPFEAEVIAIGNIDSYLRKHSNYNHELVILSEVTPIDKEYRCFCRDGKTFCHSSYSGKEYQPAPDIVIQFAESVAERILETLGINMVSVDVAVSGSELKLIEIGGVNSWGIYGSDIKLFVEEMENEAIKRFQDLN